MTNSKKSKNIQEIGIVYLVHQCNGVYEDPSDNIVGIFDNLEKAKETKQIFEQTERKLVSKYYKKVEEANQNTYHIYSIEKNKIDLEKFVE